MKKTFFLNIGLVFITIAFFSLSLLANEQSKPENGTILFLGNSLTAGFGIEKSQAYPAIIQEKIDSLKLPFTTINGGLSGETTAGGLRRIKWLFRRKIDVMVLCLGGNDGLRGLPVESSKDNLQKIIDYAREKTPGIRIILAGMQVPPNMGPEYSAQFKKIYPELAKENQIPLIPFLLKDVGGIAKLNLPDGIHPTPEGHLILAETVWEVLESELVGQ